MLCEWDGGTHIGTHVHGMIEAFDKLNCNSSFSQQMATVLRHSLCLAAVGPIIRNHIGFHTIKLAQAPVYFEPRATVHHHLIAFW